MRLSAFVLLIFFTAIGRTAPPATEDAVLKETIPTGVSPEPAQREVVRKLAKRVTRCDARYDEQGNLVSILLCNHEAFSRVGDEMRPGADAASFSRLAVVPSLKEMHLLKQPLPDNAFAVLKNWPELAVFCIEGHRPDLHPGSTKDFVPHLVGLKHLEWLELKHLFGLPGTRVDELPTYPKLVRLELDNDSATSSALPFLARNPTVRDFELHRSTMTNDEIGQLVDSLPHLERLALKPSGGKCFDHRALQHIKRLDKLVVFGFHHWRPDMFAWEGGIEHLAAMPTLKYIECTERNWDASAMRKLRGTRPDIKHVADKRIIVEFADEPRR